MRKRFLLPLACLFLCLSFAHAQSLLVECYVFEEGNRGYLNVAKVTFLDPITQSLIKESATNLDGVFSTELPVGREFLVRVEKDLFQTAEQNFSTVAVATKKK